MIPARLRWTIRRTLVRTRAGRHLWWRSHARDHELDFWATWFAQRGAAWGEDYERRMTDAAIDDPLVTSALDTLHGDEIRIIDVGAGPITRLGTHYPGKAVTVVAVDPLARQYDRLLRRFRIEPRLRTIEAEGERLLDRFAPESFDIAYAVNSVDHSYEPLHVIANMLALVRPGGVVLLRHGRNEGERRRYSGPHQWNFDAADGDMLIWNHATRHSLRDAVGARADVEAWIEGEEVLARVTSRR